MAKNISRDSSYDDAAGLKKLQGEFSNLGRPSAPDHGAQFRAMSQDGSKKSPAGNSRPGSARDLRSVYDNPGADADGRPPRGRFSSLKPLTTKPL